MNIFTKDLPQLLLTMEMNHIHQLINYIINYNYKLNNVCQLD